MSQDDYIEPDWLSKFKARPRTVRQLALKLETEAIGASVQVPIPARARGKKIIITVETVEEF